MSEQQQQAEQAEETAPGGQPAPGWARAVGGVWQSPEDVQRFLEAEVFRWSWWLASEDEHGRARVEEQLRSLRPDAMTSAAHTAHLRLALELFDAGEVPGYATVSELAKQDPRLLTRLGGWETITDCWFPGPGNHPYPDAPGDERCGATIGSIVRWLNRHAEQRAKVALLVQAQAEVLRGGDPTELLDLLLADEPDNRAEDASFGDLLQIGITNMLPSETPERARLTTGFEALDEVMGPLDVGGMTVIGGRPGDGKSSIVLRMLENWAQQKIRAAYISCEDPEGVVAARVSAMVTRLPQTVFRGGVIGSKEQLTRADEAYRDEARQYAWTSFQVGRHLHDVLRAMTRMVRRHKAEVVVVDYLQTIKGDHGIERRHELRRIASAIKSLGARLGVPVVLLSQLKRYEGKRPTMRDLREVGELEEMTENILLLWREDAIVKCPDGTGRRETKRMAVLDKAKSGPSGQVFRLAWDAISASVTDIVIEEGESSHDPDFSDDEPTEPRQSLLYSQWTGGGQ